MLEYFLSAPPSILCFVSSIRVLHARDYINSFSFTQINVQTSIFFILLISRINLSIGNTIHSEVNGLNGNLCQMTATDAFEDLKMQHTSFCTAHFVRNEKIHFSVCLFIVVDNYQIRWFYWRCTRELDSPQRQSNAVCLFFVLRTNVHCDQFHCVCWMRAKNVRKSTGNASHSDTFRARVNSLFFIFSSHYI